MPPKPPGPPAPLVTPRVPGVAVQRKRAAGPGALHTSRAPRVPVIQRMESAKAMARGLGTDQPIKELGTFVVQNKAKYIGAGLAHTSNLSTCTALAMYSHATKLSFLFHADTKTKPHALAGRIDVYVGAVNKAMGWGFDQKTLKAFYSKDVDIWILSPAGNRAGSVAIANKALEIVGGAPLRNKAKFREEDIERDTRVVVGPGGVEIILTRAQKIERAFRVASRAKTNANAALLYAEVHAASADEWADFAGGSVNAYDLVEIAVTANHAQLRAALEVKLGRSLANY